MNWPREMWDPFSWILRASGLNAVRPFLPDLAVTLSRIYKTAAHGVQGNGL